VVLKCGFGEPVKFSVAGVGFDLSVPGIGIERRKPRAEVGKFRGCQVADLVLICSTRLTEASSIR